MKNSIYLFGQQVPSLSGYCRLATETVATFAFACQLAINGNGGDDDEPKSPIKDRIENIKPLSVYNIHTAF